MSQSLCHNKHRTLEKFFFSGTGAFLQWVSLHILTGERPDTPTLNIDVPCSLATCTLSFSALETHKTQPVSTSKKQQHIQPHPGTTRNMHRSIHKWAMLNIHFYQHRKSCKQKLTSSMPDELPIPFFGFRLIVHALLLKNGRICWKTRLFAS